MSAIRATLAEIRATGALASGPNAQPVYDQLGRLHVTASGGTDGSTAIGPAAPVAFTATNPAAKLSAGATAYAAGFTVSNLGGSTMYLCSSGTVTAIGIPLVPGASVTIASSDASLWYAYAAAPCAGCITGTVAA